MIQINSINEIKPNDTILFFDTKTGKIKGIDTILKIDTTGHCDYNPFMQKDKVFQGYLKGFLKDWDAFKIDNPKQYESYTDKKFHSALLTWDYGIVFTQVLNSNNPKLAQLAWENMMNQIKSNFELRKKFIDFTNTHSNVLHLLLFQETEHQVSSDFKQQLNQEFINLF